MTPHCIIRPAADADLDEHMLHIAKDSPEAALRLREAARETFAMLTQQPEFGQLIPQSKRKYAGVRVWQIKDFPNHLAFYRPLTDGIEILRVLHASSNWQRLLGRRAR